MHRSARTTLDRRKSVTAGLTAFALACSTPILLANATGAQEVPDPADATSGSTAEVVLPTGDRVLLDGTGAEAAVSVVPAGRNGGDEPTFEALSDGDQLWVLPSDAAMLVPDVLDRDLFNVTLLADAGYTDGVPVILDPADDAGALAGTDGLTVTDWLSSIDAAAATIEPDGDWWASVRPSAQIRSRTTLRGVDRVDLDEPIQVALDDSTEIVGAPDAWAAGYDGTGTTVAVLDTGIDADHPDLAGRVVAAEEFAGTDSPTDRYGHGTHVAGIVAGDGSASGGEFAGVAPGADLMNGKVLDDSGNGTTTGLIAGMEWAVANGADVVSMSLGTRSASDGTDQMSQAVNRLTAESDVLFVIAAGNIGAAGVASPGAADAALTVGAVDKGDQLASFSGRGPRLGDFAIKPDINAPGVSIGSARASGTSIGTPIDDNYTRANGTSMATPHVAGAAAITLQAVREAGADLGAAELKARLAGSAVPNPDLTVYQQGGGRLDIPAALDAPVTTGSTPLDLGYFPYPQTDLDPVEVQVEYANRTDQAVTVDLSASATDDGGDPAANGVLTVSPASLQVPAGATTSATVTLDPTAGSVGTYGGYLVAELGGEAVNRVPLGFTLEPESYDLTVIGTDAGGDPATGLSGFDVTNAHDTTVFHETSHRYLDGRQTVRVPAGTYSVAGRIVTSGTPDEWTYVGDPEVVVEADTTVVLDATRANPITIETPAHPDAGPAGNASITHYRAAEELGSASHAYISGSTPPALSAVPSDPVRLGEFEFHSRQLLETPDGDVRYELVLPHPDRVPEDLGFVAEPELLAAVPTDVHSDVDGHVRGEYRHHFRPWSIASFGIVQNAATPYSRTDYVLADDTRYQRYSWAVTGPVTGLMTEPLTTYTAGETRNEPWFSPLQRPGFYDGGEYGTDQPTRRDGDELLFTMREWVDGGGHIGSDVSVDTVASRLYADGALIAERDDASGRVAVDPEEAEYRYEVDVDRTADWHLTSTSSRTAWTFASKAPRGDEPEPLPLLDAAYDVDVDLGNTLRSDGGEPAVMGLRVGHQLDVRGPRIEKVRVWLSGDDGATWQRQPVRRVTNDRYDVILAIPQSGGDYTSVRIDVADRGGNRLEQEVLRAWRNPTG